MRGRGVFKAKDRHSCEGRNPEYNGSINLDARLRGHDGKNSPTPQLYSRKMISIQLIRPNLISERACKTRLFCGIKKPTLITPGSKTEQK